MATFIASTPRSSLHSLAWQGFTPAECHAQLASLISGETARAASPDALPPHARLLATPVFDPDRATVDWYTPAEGPVTPLAALPPAEREALLHRLAELGQHLRQLAEQLQTQTDSPQKTLGGHLLELALRYPDETCLYRVGDQPVLICWGFEAASPGARPQDLSRLVGGPPVSADPAPVTPLPPVEAPPQRSPSLLWLLLPLLLLLLLLALLCTRWGGNAPLLSVPGLPQLNRVGPDLFGVPLPELDLEHQRQLELLARIDELRARAALCSRSTTPAPEPRKLVIPEQAALTGDMSFLAGAWECETGLRQSSSSAPVTVLYSFDTSGKGYVAINSEKGLCRSPVTATFDPQGRLTFKTDDIIPCPAGTPFSGQEVVCADQNGEALCNGRNLSATGQKWDAVFKRKE